MGNLRQPISAFLFSGLMIAPLAFGQASDSVDERTPEARVVEAAPAAEEIAVDGRLDEAAWRSARAFTQFVQRDPEQGAPPTERTEVYVLYDEQAIYIGARLFDSSPDSIVARLGRRDARLDSDQFMVFLDPYHDRRTGYYFGVNAAGTLSDGILMNDDWDTDDWDGVWEGRAHIDDKGWTVEMRIPYSQLRFYQQDEYVWGINFKRDISRKNERDFLVYQPREEAGFVSRFWDLMGIRDIRPRRQLELIPYTVSQATFDESVVDNPFNDGSKYGLDAGLDLRVGVTPNLTLNGTVNPDFGQVEVDPAVINLSDFESFFPEKRPFFIEGSQNYQNFGYGGANSNWGFNWGNPIFFYSRRVGRAPQGSLPDHAHSDVPDGTRILGAAKLTGKVGGSWNVGTVHAMTARESARLAMDGRKFSAEVEPATYYGVYRAQKDFKDSRHGLGLISTITNRFFEDDRLEDEINGRALAFGMDGWTFFGPDKKWVVNGWSGFSHVSGTEERMLALQQSSMHYYQRPDAGHVSLDSSRTSLSGFAGRVAVNKQSGRVMFNSAIGTISPGFDVNDVGFQWRGDVVNMHMASGYRWPDPGKFSRSVQLTGALFGSFDYEGNRIWSGVFGLGRLELLNYYQIGGVFAYNPENINNRRTRGGPLTLNPPGYEIGIFGNSDRRKAMVVGLDYNSYTSDAGRNASVGVEAEWKPAANISLSLNPSISWNNDNAQWVGAFDDPLAVRTYGKRYVFAELEQVTVSSSVRLNWTFTPKMSFQLYAQPLISTGDYFNYKELARSGSYEFNTFGEGASTFDPVTMMADPDGSGPAPALEIPALDFNFASLRGTAVLRWEYLPGSTLFVVWTQSRADGTEDPRFRVGPAFDQLWNAPMENIFLVKLTYWFSK